MKRSMLTSYNKKSTDSGVSARAPSVTAVGSVQVSGHTPSAWAHSSVSTFGVRYHPLLPDLSPAHGVEALVEGSEMSMLREGEFLFEKLYRLTNLILVLGSPMTPDYAWRHREGRKTRYEGKRVGGTIVVHFIKKNLWYLETALALLEGEEQSESEKYESARGVFN